MGTPDDVHALWDAIQQARTVTDRPSFIRLSTIIAWPAPNAQNTGKAHGSALGDDEVAATKKVLDFDPEKTFQVSDEVLEHTRGLVDRGRAAHQAWMTEFDELVRGAPRAARAVRPDDDPDAPRRLGRPAADVRAPTRRASRPARRPVRC